MWEGERSVCVWEGERSVCVRVRSVCRRNGRSVWEKSEGMCVREMVMVGARIPVLFEEVSD